MAEENFLVLQKENHALLRENNALHLEIIRCQEELESKTTSMVKFEREMEHRIQELQFLNAQKSQELKKKDVELEKIYGQLQRLREKPTSDQVIELNKQLPEVKRVHTSVFTANSPTEDDSWHKQYQQVSVENKSLQEQIRKLEAHLEAREREIDRLGTMLKNGSQSKNFAEIKAMYDMEAYHLEQQLEHEQLLHQVDLLNEQVAKYERKLAQSKDQIAQAEFISKQLEQSQEQNRRHLKQLETLTQRLRALEEEHATCTASYQEQQQAIAHLELFKSNAQDEISNYKAHIARLEKAWSSSSYDKMASTHAISNAEAQVSALTNEMNQLRPKYKEAQEKIIELDLRVKSLSVEKESRERELDILRTNLSTQADDKTRSLDESAQLTFKYNQLQKVIQERESELRRRNLALEDAISHNAELEAKIDNLKEKYRQQEEYTNLQQEKVSKAEMDEMQAEIDSLRKAKITLEVQTKSLKESVVSKESALREIETQMGIVHSQLDRSQAQCNDMVRAIKQLKSDLIVSQESTVKLEMECDELRKQLEWFKQVQREQAKGKQDSAIFQKKCADAMMEKQEAETKLAATIASQSTLKKQLERVNVELQSANDQSIKLTDQIDSLEGQMSTAKAELLVAQQGKAYFKSEYESTLENLGDVTTRLHQEERAHKSTKQLQKQLSRQVQDLTTQLHRAATKCSQLENALDQAQSSRKGIEMQWTLSKEDSQTIKERCSAMEMTIKRLKEEIRQQSESVSTLEKDKRHLEQLLHEMELSRDAATVKQKQALVDISIQTKKVAECENRITELQAQLKAKAKDIAHLKDVIQTLDSDNDTLHNTVDVKTEALDKLTSQLKSSQDEYSRLREHVQDCEHQLHRLEHALESKEDEVKFLQKQLNTTSAALTKANEDSSLRAGELVALQQDLQHMTIENQSLSNECTKLHFELDQVDQDHRALHQHARNIEREREAVQIELEDVKTSYRALVLEMDALDSTRQQLSHRREEISAVNESLRKQIQQVLQEKEDALHEAIELRSERTILMDQIKQLTLKLERSSEQAEEFSRSQAMLQGALESQHHVATELASERMESVAHQSTLNQKLSHLQARLSSTLHDRTELTQQVAKLTSEKSKLETLLQNCRQQLATAEIQLSEANDEREAMAAQLNNAGHGFSPLPVSSSGSTYRRTTPPSVPRSTPSSGSGNSSRFMAEAEARCKALEERLMKQDATIQQLEHSRTKFRKFAAKYERELDERDRVIEELRSSMRSLRQSSDEEETKSP
ncbi:hypothetical protein THRCLA_00739 [Thraustotheca clavata]|uniref:Uncharacterized protein n=1 Tax=Thraustotheca clavata TaxID=74557 RepID=A0A1W0AAD7_9STRA|nr:hypothetical protein THRCLA_00739 [Thraustotheca clavata]